MRKSSWLLAVGILASLSLASALEVFWKETVGGVKLFDVCSNFVNAAKSNKNTITASISGRLNPYFIEKERNIELMSGCRRIIRCHQNIRDESMSMDERRCRCGTLEKLVSSNGASLVSGGPGSHCDIKKAPFPPYCPFNMNFLRPLQGI